MKKLLLGLLLGFGWVLTLHGCSNQKEIDDPVDLEIEQPDLTGGDAENAN